MQQKNIDQRLTSQGVQSRVKVNDFIEYLLQSQIEFTGSVEMNFKDGQLRDIYTRQKIKFEN